MVVYKVWLLTFDDRVVESVDCDRDVATFFDLTREIYDELGTDEWFYTQTGAGSGRYIRTEDIKEISIREVT